MAETVEAPEAVGAATGALDILDSVHSVETTLPASLPQVPESLRARECWTLTADSSGGWWLHTFHQGRTTAWPVGRTRAEAMRLARDHAPVGLPGWIEGAR